MKRLRVSEKINQYMYIHINVPRSYNVRESTFLFIESARTRIGLAGGKVGINDGEQGKEIKENRKRKKV